MVISVILKLKVIIPTTTSGMYRWWLKMYCDIGAQFWTAAFRFIQVEVLWVVMPCSDVVE
jgi:hypothetical protein